MDEGWTWQDERSGGRPLHGGGAVSSARSAMSSSTASGASSSVWMVTFSDLTLLLLTFFVLLFSMSTLKTEAWESLIEGLPTRPDPVVVRPVVETSPEQVTTAVETVPGEDLRYLQSVFADALDRQPALSGIAVVPGGDRLVLALPDAAFRDGADGFVATPRGLAMLGELAPVLNRLPNRLRVAVAVPPDTALHGPGRTPAWGGALAGADDVATVLRSLGYGAAIEPFAHVATSVALAGRGAAVFPADHRVALVLLPEGRE